MCGVCFDALIRRRGKRRIVRVTGYTVRHASHDTSRDGELTVHLSVDVKVPVEILWTTGVQASSRQLTGLRPGVYGAIVTTLKRMPAICVHECDVARVGVEKRNYM